MPLAALATEVGGQSLSDLVHKLDISDLLSRFFQAFDDKNWLMMRECLCEHVFLDHASFRDVLPRTVSRDEYVAERRAALEALDMQHNMLNLRVELQVGAERATARCNYVVHRFHPSFDGLNDEYLHSYGHYLFALASVGGAWRIARITQHLLRNQGSHELHGKLRRHGHSGL